MFYCGKRSTNIPIEQDTYYGSGDIIRRIIKKSSPEQIKERFTKLILEVTPSYDNNVIAEKYWVNEVFDASRNPLFYNISEGGCGGNLIAGLNEEEKKQVYYKIGIGNKGKKVPEYVKQIASIRHKGTIHSRETRRKMSIGRKGIKNPFNQRKNHEELLKKYQERFSGRGNPRATFVKVMNNNDIELFQGIRKEVEEWCEDKGICSGASVKKMLHNKITFHPKYNMKNSPNAKQYDGIRFEYV